MTANGLVPDQPAVLNGLFSEGPSLPDLDPDGRTVVADLTLLTSTNDIYRRNPNLMRAFELNVTSAGQTQSFQIASVDADETTGELHLTVDGLNQPLGIYGAGDSFELIPRFFRVQTGGIPDELPASAAIVIRFQATEADEDGNPDPLNVTPLTADPAELNAEPNNRDLRFFRFVVEFDISVDSSPVTPSTPLPSLNFLRFPFKF